MLFLPEFLYRLQFGEAALALGTTTTPVPPPATHYRKHWKEEVWALRTPRGSRELESPDEQELRNDPFDWSPLNWYRQLWPRMRAFALPSFSHGMVRINLRGRDPQGMVDPEEYASYCDELTDALWSLRNARSGRPIIKAVTRTRRSHTEDGEYLPPADLMITWNPEESTDVAESSLVGRIGPVPWLRTGGHSPDGFCILCGPGIKPGSRLRDNATVTDLTATMLQMLGITLPSYVEGRSLI
jgi:predicted AlkP superfamily phosphohydrolase/phosphomutase